MLAALDSRLGRGTPWMKIFGNLGNEASRWGIFVRRRFLALGILDDHVRLNGPRKEKLLVARETGGCFQIQAASGKKVPSGETR